MLVAAIVPESIEYHIPHVVPSLLMSFVTWGILIVASVVIAHKRKVVPGKAQLLLESAIGYITDLADEFVGSDAPKYYPLFIGLFLYILTGNMIGLIPGLLSPTADPNTTFGLAILVFLYYNFEGIRTQGWGYFKQFSGPKMPWFMFPVSLLLISTEILSFFTRPFSLGLRLFCNIFSKELFLEILALLLIQFLLSPHLLDKWFAAAPILLRPAIIILGLIIGFIQALVFLILSMSYIAGAVRAAQH